MIIYSDLKLDIEKTRFHGILLVEVTLSIAAQDLRIVPEQWSLYKIQKYNM